MRITVLGKSPAWQDAGGACSGYLVEDDNTRVLVDCGSGVFGRLRQVADYREVDVVVISHMHGDHFLDLVPYACALAYGPRHPPGSDDPARPRLLVPPGAIELLRTIGEIGGQSSLFERAFRMREYDVTETARLGSLRATFQPVPHYIPTNAIELTPTDGGGRFTFGADHCPTDALNTFAADTDLLLIEATLAQPEHGDMRGHLTPRQSGEHAAACGARRAVLTHISDELDHEWALAEAGRAYDGPLEIARTGAVYIV